MNFNQKNIKYRYDTGKSRTLLELACERSEAQNQARAAQTHASYWHSCDATQATKEGRAGEGRAYRRQGRGGKSRAGGLEVGRHARRGVGLDAEVGAQVFTPAQRCQA